MAGRLYWCCSRPWLWRCRPTGSGWSNASSIGQGTQTGPLAIWRPHSPGGTSAAFPDGLDRVTAPFDCGPCPLGGRLNNRRMMAPALPAQSVDQLRCDFALEALIGRSHVNPSVKFTDQRPKLRIMQRLLVNRGVIHLPRYRQIGTECSSA